MKRTKLGSRKEAAVAAAMTMVTITACLGTPDRWSKSLKQESRISAFRESIQAYIYPDRVHGQRHAGQVFEAGYFFCLVG